MTIQQKLDSFSMVLAEHIRSNDQMIKQFEQLETEVKELQQQPVTANWYDFTDEQKLMLGDIVKNFIDKLTRDMSSTTVYLRDGSVEVSVEIDVQNLIEDALPYGMSDKFIDYLNDEITEQREEQQQDCEESKNN